MNSADSQSHCPNTKDTAQLLATIGRKKQMTAPNEQLQPNGRIRILVVDDHAAIRLGLRALFFSKPKWEVCGEAESGEEAIEKVKHLKPDVIVLDMTLPNMSGLAALGEIRKIAPSTKVVIFTMHDSLQMRTLAAQAGADGFVAKSKTSALLISEIERLLARHEQITEQ
jgi:two-component system, NarL family, response regulator NreC